MTLPSLPMPASLSSPHSALRKQRRCATRSANAIGHRSQASSRRAIISRAPGSRSGTIIGRPEILRFLEERESHAYVVSRYDRCDRAAILRRIARTRTTARARSARRGAASAPAQPPAVKAGWVVQDMRTPEKRLPGRGVRLSICVSQDRRTAGREGWQGPHLEARARWHCRDRGLVHGAERAEGAAQLRRHVVGRRPRRSDRHRHRIGEGERARSRLTARISSTTSRWAPTARSTRPT